MGQKGVPWSGRLLYRVTCRAVPDANGSASGTDRIRCDRLAKLASSRPGRHRRGPVEVDVWSSSKPKSFLVGQAEASVRYWPQPHVGRVGLRRVPEDGKGEISGKNGGF